jgi:two-component system invasion response regulator UvrY
MIQKTMQDKIKIVLIEDQKLIRDGIEMMLSFSDLDVETVAKFTSGEEFFNAMGNLDFNMILLDILLPGITGVEVASRLRVERPSVKILVVSGEGNRIMFQKLLSLGIDGFISKDSPYEELCDAISIIALGGEYYGKDIACLVHRIRESKPEIDDGIFTDRELEIIDLCSKGYLAKEIAYHLNIGMKTVNTHKYNIFRKLGINTTLELVSYASKHHILDF